MGGGAPEYIDCSGLSYIGEPSTMDCSEGAIKEGAENGVEYCISNNQMNYWTAEAWCDAIGGKLIDLSVDCGPCIDNMGYVTSLSFIADNLVWSYRGRCDNLSDFYGWSQSVATIGQANLYLDSYMKAVDRDTVQYAICRNK